MFEEFSRRNRAVIAALSLAAERDWGDITLADIARESNLSLGDLRRDFISKSDILRAFQAEVDAQVLSRVKLGDPEDSVRDQIFELLMMRFEVMTPYKPALKHIAAHLRCHPGEASKIACTRLISQYWTLSSAGAKLHGPSGALRIIGLSAVYGKAFSVWLEDDSPSLDKTMATLDRGLKNGESALKNVEKACNTFCGLLRGLKRDFKQRNEPDGETPPSPEPVPSPS